MQVALGETLVAGARDILSNRAVEHVEAVDACEQTVAEPLDSLQLTLAQPAMESTAKPRQSET